MGFQAMLCKGLLFILVLNIPGFPGIFLPTQEQSIRNPSGDLLRHLSSSISLGWGFLFVWSGFFRGGIVCFFVAWIKNSLG